MKHLVKTIAILLVAMIATTSCQTAGTDSTTQPLGTTTAAVDGSTAETTANDNTFLASEEPITLSAHIHWSNIYVLNDDMPVIKKAAEITNVSLHGTASAMEGDSTQAFNLMIAGKDIPDLVGGVRDDINKYGVEGAFTPLNDLIEQYAPNFKKVLDANPDVKGAITASDGNIYQIPFIFSNNVAETWFIRQDWLDKVGMEAPTTVQELHDVLLAFYNNDPNGNGEKDEIGFFSRITGETNNKLLGLLSLFGINDNWHIGADGKVALGLYTPAYKDAMKNVSQWYSEGLIDKEVFTRGGQARDMLYPENNGGLTHDWYPSTSGYNDKMTDVVPGFKLTGILPPADINGDQWEVSHRNKLTGAGWAISATNKYPEETMKYMDFWWSEEGRRLSTYGIEGDTYTMVDGEPVYTDKVLSSSDPINAYMAKIGGQIEQIAFLHDASYENFMMSEEGSKSLKMYQDAQVVDKLYVNLPALSFTGDELDTITSKYPPCRTYMLEQEQKWTFDGSNIDAEYDNYMSTLKSMGMDEIVAIYQAAYDRLTGN